MLVVVVEASMSLDQQRYVGMEQNTPQDQGKCGIISALEETKVLHRETQFFLMKENLTVRKDDGFMFSGS